MTAAEIVSSGATGGPARSAGTSSAVDPSAVRRVDPASLRGMIGPRTAYACEACGFWQRWFASGPPPTCPVCTDYRNALPDEGFSFVTHDELDERLTAEVAEVVPGVYEVRTRPRFGLDSVGWLLETELGLLGWEAAGHYHADVLDEIRGRGGLAVLGSSHVHGFGAIHQLQDELDPAVVAIGERHLTWTKAFRPTWPVDERLELAPGVVAHVSGGHFDGHQVLHDAGRGLLFCGDALKVDVDEDGSPVALSAHKAFHAQVPLSHGDVRRYAALVETLDFDTVLTPFECVKGVTTADVLHLFDHLLSGPPDPAPVELAGLRRR